MVQVTKLAHVGFRAQSLSVQAELYNDRWGLERMDEHGGEMFFRADGPDHHVLTLHSSETPGLHHIGLDAAIHPLPTDGTQLEVPVQEAGRWH